MWPATVKPQPRLPPSTQRWPTVEALPRPHCTHKQGLYPTVYRDLAGHGGASVSKCPMVTAPNPSLRTCSPVVPNSGHCESSGWCAAGVHSCHPHHSHCRWVPQKLGKEETRKDGPPIHSPSLCPPHPPPDPKTHHHICKHTASSLPSPLLLLLCRTGTQGPSSPGLAGCLVLCCLQMGGSD
jgi:hypothetical protein